jgi:hypothetical protein
VTRAIVIVMLGLVLGLSPGLSTDVAATSEETD